MSILQAALEREIINQCQALAERRILDECLARKLKVRFGSGYVCIQDPSDLSTGIGMDIIYAVLAFEEDKESGRNG